MAFQINGQTVINNSRVASSMTGIAPLAHDQGEWNTATYTFNSGFGNWSAGSVNFETQSLQPSDFEDFSEMWINLNPTNIGGAPNTFGSNVTIQFDGSGGDETYTIIPSSWSIGADFECWIRISNLDTNNFMVETFLADQSYNVDFSPPMPLNLQNVYFITEATFSNTNATTDAIVIDWPTWGGGTNLSMIHNTYWR